MRIIRVTMQERWEASRGDIHKNKKKYNRKTKFKKRYDNDNKEEDHS